MISFVGYVNSMIVENGILARLPMDILSQTTIENKTAETIKKIAGEKEAAAKRRERAQKDSLVLSKTLETLKGYLQSE